MAEASVDNYQIILPMNLVVNAVILTEFVKPSSGLDTEPEPSLIYYKTEPAKEGTNEEASDPEQSGNSEEKENTSENVQSTATGTILSKSVKVLLFKYQFSIRTICTFLTFFT